MHLHLDLVGGISGDMFISAILDLFPNYGDLLAGQIELAGFPDLVSLKYGPFNDGTLSGTHFNVHAEKDATGHHHRHYSEIQRIISESNLDDETKKISLEIFRIIAVAEAQIHDKTIESVAFHEVGAWDSIADVICASFLIAQSNINSTSISDLPLGGGQVKTAHGMLPIPAPATALILKDFRFVDDGISGERITPTGAAILKYLSPDVEPHKYPQEDKGNLINQGFGFGTKKFPGISNVLRLLHFDAAQPAAADQDSIGWTTDTIQMLAFELDDQTPEEIAHCVDTLQRDTAVIDVLQYSVTGKKNRMATSLRVLCQPDKTDSILRLCFKLTTTLGIRQTETKRAILHRRPIETTVSDTLYKSKLAQRPGGDTVKAEMDDLRDMQTLQEQRKLRQSIERQAQEQSKE
jgi:pyridinium-3,5-bisthiocarboxylic acid mononucleotide nickel chelatase